LVSAFTKKSLRDMEIHSDGRREGPGRKVLEQARGGREGKKAIEDGLDGNSM